MKHTNQELEQGVLGKVIDNSAYLASLEFMETKYFAFVEHRMIWEQIIKEAIRLGRVDAAILRPFFKNSGFPELLNQIINESRMVVDVRAHGFEIRHLWQKRELEEKLHNSLRDLELGNFDAISSNLQNEVSGLSFEDNIQKTESLAEIEEQIGDEPDKFFETSLKKFNKAMNGGLFIGELITLGAFSSVGKTTIVQSFILDLARQKVKCLFISLEMRKTSVWQKFISNISRIPVGRLRVKDIYRGEEERVEFAKKETRSLPVYINQSVGLTIKDLEKIVKNQIKKTGVDVVFVDYIQIMKYHDKNGKLESTGIKEITTGLKAIAKNLNVCVFALSQLTRDKSKSNNYVPSLNDFKGSHGIVEDSDVVLVLHRDKLDSRDKEEFSKNGRLVIRKSRFGQGDSIDIVFDGTSGRYREVDSV